MGSALRAERARRRWTREELAVHAGVSYAAIAQIESGRRTAVRIDTVLALADALGISVDRMLSRDASVHPPLEHVLFPYDTDAGFVDVAGGVVADAVRCDEPVLVVTTARNTRLLRKALGDDAARVDFAGVARWYDSPVGALNRYRAYLEERLREDHRWVWVVGELFGAGQPPDDAMADWCRYEAIVNVSLGLMPATIVCAYDTRVLDDELIAAGHRTHPQISLGGSWTASAAYRGGEEAILEPWKTN